MHDFGNVFSDWYYSILYDVRLSRFCEVWMSILTVAVKWRVFYRLYAECLSITEVAHISWQCSLRTLYCMYDLYTCDFLNTCDFLKCFSVHGCMGEQFHWNDVVCRLVRIEKVLEERWLVWIWLTIRSMILDLRESVRSGGKSSSSSSYSFNKKLTCATKYNGT